MNFVEKIKNSINIICAKYLNDKEEIEYLPIFYIAGSQTLPPPLSSEEEEELIHQLSEENNLEIRQKLVERNLRLVVYIAKKFGREASCLLTVVDSLYDKRNLTSKEREISLNQMIELALEAAIL